MFAHGVEMNAMVAFESHNFIFFAAILSLSFILHNFLMVGFLTFLEQLSFHFECPEHCDTVMGNGWHDVLFH